MDRYPNLDLGTPFSATALQNHMDTFLGDLSSHMSSELETLKPEHLDKIGEEKLKEIMSKATTLLRHHDPAWFLCALMGERA